MVTGRREIEVPVAPSGVLVLHQERAVGPLCLVGVADHRRLLSHRSYNNRGSPGFLDK